MIEYLGREPTGAIYKTLITKNDIKKLKRLHRKKNRDSDGLFLVEGAKCVAEAMACRADIKTIYVEENAYSDHRPLYNDANVIPSDRKSLQAVSQLSTAPEILAVASMRTHDMDRTRLLEGRTLVLDAVRDPGNLGTLIRIADWFGIEQILLSTDCVDLYNSKVVQSTMGGLFRMNIMTGDLIEAAALMKENDLPVLSAVMNGTPMTDRRPFDRGMLILGNESNGISADLLAASTGTISIAGRGGAESLNVAVAGGILAHWLTN